MGIYEMVVVGTVVLFCLIVSGLFLHIKNKSKADKHAGNQIATIN